MTARSPTWTVLPARTETGLDRPLVGTLDATLEYAADHSFRGVEYRPGLWGPLWRLFDRVAPRPLAGTIDPRPDSLSRPGAATRGLSPELTHVGTACFLMAYTQASVIARQTGYGAAHDLERRYRETASQLADRLATETTSHGAGGSREPPTMDGPLPAPGSAQPRQVTRPLHGIDGLALLRARWVGKQTRDGREAVPVLTHEGRAEEFLARWVPVEETGTVGDRPAVEVGMAAQLVAELYRTTGNDAVGEMGHSLLDSLATDQRTLPEEWRQDDDSRPDVDGSTLERGALLEGMAYLVDALDATEHWSTLDTLTTVYLTTLFTVDSMQGEWAGSGRSIDPKDTWARSQAVLTLTAVGALDLAEVVLGGLVESLADGERVPDSSRSRYTSGRTTIEWSQAWFCYALATYLHARLRANQATVTTGTR